MFFKLLVIVLSCVFSLTAQAWILNNDQSSVSFVSVKNKVVAEIHTFSKLTGGIDETGAAKIVIDPSSIESNIDIRNDRMREHLFNTVKFPSIKIETNVTSVIGELDEGDSNVVELPATLALHGESKEIQLNARVSKLSENRLLVTSTTPVLIMASQYELVQGIKKLASLAGNIEIVETVPVNFSLLFTQSNDK